MAGPEFISTEEAMARLGVNRRLFRRLVGLDPGGKFPWVRNWMRPNEALSTAREHYWAAKDVDALARIIDGWRDVAPEIPDDEAQEDEPKKKT